MITHNDGSYFHSNAASNSFIGRFEGSAELNNCMSEDAVSDFIQSSRPDLFRELSCLPVPSYDILGDSRAPSSTDHDNLAFDGGKGNTDPVLENEAASSRSKPPLLRTLTAAPFKHQNWSDRESLELQHKRYLLSRLLNGYILVLQNGTRLGSELCSHPLCFRKQLASGAKRFCLSLTRKQDSPLPTDVTRRPSLCYDLECLEYLFDSQALQRLFKPKALQLAPQNGDAADDRASSSSIDMPHQGATSNPSPVSDPDFAFDYPSNSERAIQIRQDKTEEISNILEDVSKRAARVVASDYKPGDDLSLRRPADLLPPVERYKKQGLTRYDRIRWKRFQLDAVPTDGARDPRRPRVTKPSLSNTPETTPMCYCREAEGDGEIIRCGSELCQIGTFHLACCQIDEPPGVNERFYCYYCAPNLGAIVEREVVVHGIPPEEELEESDHNSSAVSDIADDANDEADEDCHHEPAPLTGSTLVEDHSPPPFVLPAQVDGSASPQQGSKLPAVMSMPLPESSSNTTFRDLAPFIESDLRPDSHHKLTPAEGRLVKEWKETSPPSTLIAALAGQLATREESGQSAKPMDVVTPPVNAKLSQLLSEV